MSIKILMHLLTRSIDIATAQILLGPDAIIGITCSTSEEAQAATAAGASYLGIGTVFATPTYDSLESSAAR